MQEKLATAVSAAVTAFAEGPAHTGVCRSLRHSAAKPSLATPGYRILHPSSLPPLPRSPLYPCPFPPPTNPFLSKAPPHYLHAVAWNVLYLARSGGHQCFDRRSRADCPQPVRAGARAGRGVSGLVSAHACACRQWAGRQRGCVLLLPGAQACEQALGRAGGVVPRTHCVRDPAIPIVQPNARRPACRVDSGFDVRAHTDEITRLLGQDEALRRLHTELVCYCYCCCCCCCCGCCCCCCYCCCACLFVVASAGLTAAAAVWPELELLMLPAEKRHADVCVG